MIETAVKERPILFSGSMVRAILEGRKTVTRRVVKFPCPGLIGYHYNEMERYPYYFRRKDAVWNSFKTIEDLAAKHCPYGTVGNRLWVRETWRPALSDTHDCYAYRATMDYECGKSMPADFEQMRSYSGGWKPSIHMPRKASRLNLEITGVRVERLQDITQEQAMCEGVDQATCPVMQIGNSAAGADWVGGFKKLWDGINSDRPGCNWESNPWVWAVEFKKVEG